MIFFASQNKIINLTRSFPGISFLQHWEGRLHIIYQETIIVYNTTKHFESSVK